ncbi:MAG TPA: SDR family NAD(P)-dependent oxidoreductase, partial [Cytophagaceae bacterium]
MKYALVTGGSRGIGRAICIKLSEMGYYVLVNYATNEKEAQKTLALIEQAKGQGEIMQFDVASETSVENALGQWIQQHPDKVIEVLINNA